MLKEQQVSKHKSEAISSSKKVKGNDSSSNILLWIGGLALGALTLAELNGESPAEDIVSEDIQTQIRKDYDKLIAEEYTNPLFELRETYYKLGKLDDVNEFETNLLIDQIRKGRPDHKEASMLSVYVTERQRKLLLASKEFSSIPNKVLLHYDYADRYDRIMVPYNRLKGTIILPDPYLEDPFKGISAGTLERIAKTFAAWKVPESIVRETMVRILDHELAVFFVGKMNELLPYNRNDKC